MNTPETTNSDDPTNSDEKSYDDPFGFDWQSYARDVWQAEANEKEQSRLAAEKKVAERLIEMLAGWFDPPILGATPLGGTAEVDGVRFVLRHDYGDERLAMIRACAGCGQDVASQVLKTWADIGKCLSRGPEGGDRAEISEYSWDYHRCPEPDPADLVSVLRHLLLFAYDWDTGEPVLPLYAIRRAENALAASEGKGIGVDTYA